MLQTARNATAWCVCDVYRVCLCLCCCCAADELDNLAFRPVRWCGVVLQAAVWHVVVLIYLGAFLAAVFDLSEGYPGAGVWALAYLAPSTLVASSITDVRMVLLLYGSASALYFLWCVLFGMARGMGDDLWGPNGGNLVSIMAALLIDTTPYFAAAYIFIVARGYTAIAVRNRVERCMQAVSKVEADHEMAMRAARVQMPPFALRLLHGKTAGVELEETTAVLVFRILTRCRSTRRTMKRAQSGGSLASGTREQSVRSYVGDDSDAGTVEEGSGRGGRERRRKRKRKRKGRSRSRQRNSKRRSSATSDMFMMDSTDEDAQSEMQGFTSPSPMHHLGSGPPVGVLKGLQGQPTDMSTVHTFDPLLDTAPSAAQSAKQAAAERDEQLARVTLRAVGTIERVLQHGAFGRRATCVSVVGQDVIVAVHGEDSKVFGLGYDDDNQIDEEDTQRAADARRQSRGASSSSGSRSSSARRTPRDGAGTDSSGTETDRSSSRRTRNDDEVEKEHPITPDAVGCFNIATALEIALKASWVVRDQARAGGLEPNCSVRLGAGIAFGSKTVCGFLSSGSSAHRWSVFGDGASEAQ